MTSCSRIQEKPVITADLSLEETSSNQESTTVSTDETSVTGLEETIKGTGLNLKKLQSLENSFTVTYAFPDVSFKRPLEFQNAGDSSGRIFIVEQGGKIFIVDSQKDSKAELFLDISDRVDDSGNEKGLLGLAFHPDFKGNGQFFVNYTTINSSVVSRFTIARDNPNTVDSQSEEIIITFKQPYANHNGGKLAFAPGDGYLYIAAGDGGGAGDPQKNGQNLKTLLGKILRIDVDSKYSGLSYSIPSDNPFKDNKEGYREEIYA
ncbi:MAG: PQQ-dependent sugar dehydrogenase, partial [Nitrososphaeraceae archaeon]